MRQHFYVMHFFLASEKQNQVPLKEELIKHIEQALYLEDVLVQYFLSVLQVLFLLKMLI
jgi:hypothetical protein